MGKGLHDETVNPLPDDRHRLAPAPRIRRCCSADPDHCSVLCERRFDDADEDPHDDAADEEPHDDAADEDPHNDAADEEPHDDAADEDPHNDADDEDPHDDADDEDALGPDPAPIPPAAVRGPRTTSRERLSGPFAERRSLAKPVTERGYEGYVAKDEASTYEGGPTRRWLKVKQRDWTVEEDRWQRRISVAPPTR